jgi:Domain of unknown function (DUF4326)
MNRWTLSRATGATLHPGVRSVARPSRWGNPYAVATYGRTEALRRYQEGLDAMTPEERAAWLAPLRDCTGLACWCTPDEACHADILIAAIAALPPRNQPMWYWIHRFPAWLTRYDDFRAFLEALNACDPEDIRAWYVTRGPTVGGGPTP